MKESIGLIACFIAVFAGMSSIPSNKSPAANQNQQPVQIVAPVAIQPPPGAPTMSVTIAGFQDEYATLNHTTTVYQMSPLAPGTYAGDDGRGIVQVVRNGIRAGGQDNWTVQVIPYYLNLTHTTMAYVGPVDRTPGNAYNANVYGPQPGIGVNRSNVSATFRFN